MLRGSTVVIIGGFGSTVIWLALGRTIYKRLWIRGNNKDYYTLYRAFSDLETGSEWLYMHFSVLELTLSLCCMNALTRNAGVMAVPQAHWLLWS
jgi:hypothetical protein